MTHGPVAKKRRSNAEDDEENSIDAMPIPPDGGWGWMVAFASFAIHIVTDGITYSYGIFYEEFLTYFNEGKGYTALIVSLLVGVTLCSGPISSSFVNKYGCRAVTIAGAILAGICLVISSFAQNVLTLIFTVGVGTGFGFGLIYLPAIVSVTTYFEKYRSLATGIAVCGSGLGTFIFSPLTEYLIGEFGWRGATLILAGVVFNCVIFGAMFRPLEPPKRQKRNKLLYTDEQIPLKEIAEGVEENHKLVVVPVVVETKATSPIDDPEEFQEKKRSNSHSQFMRNNNNSHSNNNNNKSNSDKRRSDNFLSVDQPHGVMARSVSIGQDMTSNYQKGNRQNALAIDAQSERKLRPTWSQPLLSHAQTEASNLTGIRKNKLSESGTMYRPDVFYQGSLMNIPRYRSRGELSITKEERHTWQKPIIDGEEKAVILGCISVSKETKDTFDMIMDFSIFRDVLFIIFTLSNFCTSIGFNVPYVFIAPLGTDLGLSKPERSYLLSTIGFANTIGRIVLGYLSDKPYVNRLMVYNACLTLCGVATAFSVLCQDFASLMVYSVVFGFTIGAYVGLTSVILVDLLGLEKLTNAFGLLLLFQGIASLIGPPFAGLLYDMTKTYVPAFLMAGITIALSGVVLFAIPPLQRRRDRQQPIHFDIHSGEGA